MNMKDNKFITILISILLASPIYGQNITRDRLIHSADSLMREYSFSKAVDQYKEALKFSRTPNDSVEVEDKIVKGQNALNMMGYCSDPVVIASKKYSIKDFFLYYPLQDKSWRKVPNQLDSLSRNPFVNATYVPSGANTLYYSASEGDGVAHIRTTTKKDTVWTSPAQISSLSASTDDEIFPMLSGDGKTLYFSSKGFYGIGGYDLYMCRWDEDSKDWGDPVNMGFPYSSPYDDFLFINSDDGKYSVFASNRECGRDSVVVYILEYDAMPLRREITDSKELKEIASLKTEAAKKKNSDNIDPQDPQTKAYVDKIREIRSLKDSISAFTAALDAKRNTISKLSGSEREAVMQEIIEKEAMVPKMNKAYIQASSELQKMEMDFIRKGIVVDPLKAQAEIKSDSPQKSYRFSKNSYGPSVRLKFEKPAFDYTFKISNPGSFAPDNNLPSGLVYQIQFMSSSSALAEKDLKGLSPVFVRKGSKSNVYTVGVFRSYDEAVSALTKVKKVGFKSAFIVAFKDGRSVTVAQARQSQSSSSKSSGSGSYMVKIYPSDGKSLPAGSVAVIREHSEKDIVKTMENGAVVYLTGPFKSQSAANALVSALKEIGVSNTSVEAE